MKKTSFFLVMVICLIISQVALSQINYGTVRVDGYPKITKGAFWSQRPEAEMIYNGSEPPGFTVYTLESDYFVRFVDGEHNQFDGNYIVFPKGEKVYTDDKSGIFYSAICGNRIEYIKPVENIRIQRIPDTINKKHLSDGKIKVDTVYKYIYIDDKDPVQGCNVIVVNTGYGYNYPYYQQNYCPIYYPPFPLWNLWGGCGYSVNNYNNYITNNYYTENNNYNINNYYRHPKPQPDDGHGVDPGPVPGDGSGIDPGGQPGDGGSGIDPGGQGGEKRGGNINSTPNYQTRNNSSTGSRNVSSQRYQKPATKTQTTQNRSSGKSVTQSSVTTARYQKPATVKTQTTQSRNYSGGNTKNYSTPKSYSGAQRSYSSQSRSYSGGGASRSIPSGGIGGSRSSYSAPSRSGGGHR